MRYQNDFTNSYHGQWGGQKRKEMTFWWCQLVYQTGKRNYFEADLTFETSPSYWKPISLFSYIGNCKEPAFKIIIIAN